MVSEDFLSKLPADLRNMIGKTVERKLADGRVIRFVVGDITGDGKIDDDDITILQLLCKGGATGDALFSQLTPEQLAACDITGDGYINREDLLELCKKLINTPPKKSIDDKLSGLRDKIRPKNQ